MTKEQKKERATLLLRKYDFARKELRKLEGDLHKAVREYAMADGCYVGMTKDTFRNHLQMEKERLEREAV